MMLHRPLSALSTTCLALLIVLAGCAGPEAATDRAPAQTPTVYDDPALVQRYQELITPEDLASHLFVFASDYFEGREATTRGQKLAATYLAGQYRKLGIEPRGTTEPEHSFAPEEYFQPFSVYGQRLTEATLTVRNTGEPVAVSRFMHEEQDGQSYPQFGDLPVSEGEVVFAGYGIGDENLGYSDYAALQEAGIDPADKWLLVLGDEPLSDAEASLLPTEDGGPSAWTTSRFNKYRPAINADASGLLVVGDVSPRAEQSVAQQARAEMERRQASAGSLSLEAEEEDFSYPPIYVISTELANQILASSGRTVQELQQQIDQSLEPDVFEIDDVNVEARLSIETYEAETENVLAYIEGSDPELRDEVVVLTAHYDHVGLDPTLEDPVYNGADDDGSGTVALLELAEAFMQAKRDGNGPRRSLLFLSVSAEEKGLLGSAYYADEEPVFPLENTVANFNMDMISRSDPTRDGGTDYVYVIGSRIISQDLDDILVRVNEETGIDITLDHRFNTPDDPNQFYRRSDHWNFGKHSIPFIFYFTGTHEDYHQPGDEPHKVDYEKHARVTRLIFATAWQVANQDERPRVTGEGFN